jgi:hypothetical protein
MEIYATPQTRGYHLLNLIGTAGVSRRVWEPLRAQVADYEEQWRKPNSWFINGDLVLATRIKK